MIREAETDIATGNVIDAAKFFAEIEAELKARGAWRSPAKKRKGSATGKKL